MEDPEDPDTAGETLTDQPDHDFAIARVEGCRRLIEQQQGSFEDETASDVHALPFPAGERRRRQLPQPFRDAQPRQQLGCPLTTGIAIDPAVHERLCHDVDRGHPRHRSQELAHYSIVDRRAASTCLGSAVARSSTPVSWASRMRPESTP